MFFVPYGTGLFCFGACWMTQGQMSPRGYGAEKKCCDWSVLSIGSFIFRPLGAGLYSEAVGRGLRSQNNEQPPYAICSVRSIENMLMFCEYIGKHTVVVNY